MNFCKEAIKEFKDLVNLAIALKQKTKHDLFIDYAPHVNQIDIYFYYNGWENNRIKGADFHLFFKTHNFITVMFKPKDKVIKMKPTKYIKKYIKNREIEEMNLKFRIGAEFSHPKHVFILSDRIL